MPKSVATVVESQKSLIKRRKKHVAGHGRDVTPEDLVFSDTPGIMDDGNFSFGVCHVCSWRGPGRRARDKARRDAAEHYLLAH